MSLHLIYVDKDGPVAAAYRKEIAERAVLSLRACEPGKRVWSRLAPAEDAERYGVEVLLTAQDTRVTDLWQVTLQGTEVTHKLLRQTLRGLVQPTGVATEDSAWGRGCSKYEAEQQARAARKRGPEAPRPAFRLEEILI